MWIFNGIIILLMIVFVIGAVFSDGGVIYEMDKNL
jgi:hypothetical protein